MKIAITKTYGVRELYYEIVLYIEAIGIERKKILKQSIKSFET